MNFPLKYFTSSFISIIGIVFFILFFPLSSYSISKNNHPPIHVDAQVNTAVLTVGDKVTFTVTITADTDIKLDPINFNPFFRGFNVLNDGIDRPEMVDNQIITKYWYQLRADKVGKYVFPSIPVSFSAPDPQYPSKMIQGQTLTPEVKIEILSILRLQGEPTDIHDIKPILEMAPDWLTYALYILILLIILGSLVIWVQKSKKIVASEQIVAPPLSPYNQAILELKALKSKNLLSKSLYKEHYFKLSEIFRRYLGGRFHIPALDWTSQEIEIWLGNGNILEKNLCKKVGTIFEYTDQVKFAKVKPSSFASDKTINFIYQFIDETKEPPQIINNHQQFTL